MGDHIKGGKPIGVDALRAKGDLALAHVQQQPGRALEHPARGQGQGRDIDR
nr:hypothetical protein [Bordetella avium]